MDVGAISNNSSDIQSILINGINGVKRNTNGNTPVNQTAEYAKKGDPMYMAEMDSDEDGTVTLDEFREYCKSKGMSTKSMMKMSQLASFYRTMKAESETIDYISKLIPNVHPNVKQTNLDSAHVKSGEGMFNVSADSNNAKNVTYNEYMAYCEQNASPLEIRANAKAEETENGNLKIKNYGKAAVSYRNSNTGILKSTFENVA